MNCMGKKVCNRKRPAACFAQNTLLYHLVALGGGSSWKLKSLGITGSVSLGVEVLKKTLQIYRKI